MKYQISWMENKVSSQGNAYIKMTLVDEGGNEFNDVAVFTSFLGYKDIINGGTVEGVLTEKDWQGKKSYTLNNANQTVKTGFGGAGGVKMMEKKAESIKIAQENKSESIKHASVMRMSHETALAEIQHIKEGPDGEIMDFNNNFVAIFQKWKNWYDSKWSEPF